MAALSAAFHLTSDPCWQDHYDISLYQMGWRLGGKGASGRNPKHHDRIEEHGLHVWLGFYREAFELIRRCYSERDTGRPTPLADVNQAFLPCYRLAGVEYVNGKKSPWTVDFPPQPGQPGDLETAEPGLWQVVARVYRFMKTLDAQGAGLFTGLQSPHSEPESLGKRAGLPLEFSHLKMKLSLGGLAVLELIPMLFGKAGSKKLRRSKLSRRSILWLLDRCRSEAWASVSDRLEKDQQARRSWIMMDFFLATLKGLHCEEITDFDSMRQLDRYDFREFLAAHGATDLTLRSPAICGFYNLGFAYLGGKKSQPSLAAGVMLRFSLQMFFTYRGAMFWKMRGGMGDVVFAPLYQVLKKRGVNFHFFHKATHLGLSPDRSKIETVELVQQVQTREGKPYEPLIAIGGEACWPSEPLFEQLREGEELAARGVDFEADCSGRETGKTVTLQAGTHFDALILGISLPALPPLTKELASANPAFAAMLQRLPTVQTCAAQLWLKPGLQELGWDPETALFDDDQEALGTWSDMTHLLPLESWGETKVGHLGYFCGVLEDLEPEPGESEAAFRKLANQVAVEKGRALLSQLGRIWSGGREKGGATALDPDALVGSAESMEKQFFKANTFLSDRYVLAAKDTHRYRLKTDASGFENLYLAGDWTDNGLNYGCIEAATRSGHQAARACLKKMQVPRASTVNPAK